LTEYNKSCWIITEGIAGTENQCIGVAQALAITPVIKRIKLRFPWKQLSPYLNIGLRYALSSDSDRISEPYPDIVIASGRKSIAIALYIKKMSKGKSFIVQIQDPRVKYLEFDLIAIPQHDPSRGENIIVTTCALHKVTAKKLEEEKEKFEKKLSYLQKPRIAVLIGGSSKHYNMSVQNTEKLIEQLSSIDASLMITTSRRTGEQNTNILRERLKGDNIFFWDGKGENPYFAFLAMADYIIVTEDSVSMTSEAISTGKPVYIAALEGGSKRIDLFHKLLKEQGYTKPFKGKLESWSYQPPNDIITVVNEIKKRIKIKE